MILNFVKMADSSRWQLIEADWQLPKVDHLLSQPRSFHQTSEACGTLQVAMIGFARLRRGENFPHQTKKSSQSPTNKASMSLAQVLLNKAADCPALDALESGACG